MRTGSGNSADLMSQMLATSSSDVNPAFYIKIAVGGSANVTHVDFTMPAVVLSIPAVNAEQVVSTTINFTAQGYTGSAFDIGQSNELTIDYVTANA